MSATASAPRGRRAPMSASTATDSTSGAGTGAGVGAADQSRRSIARAGIGAADRGIEGDGAQGAMSVGVRRQHRRGEENQQNPDRDQRGSDASQALSHRERSGLNRGSSCMVRSV